MQFRALGLCLLLVPFFAYSQGRSPAVEDFVGIEVEQPTTAPQGTESLFNLEQDIKKHDEKVLAAAYAPAPVEASSNWSVTAVVGFSLLLALPLFIWSMMMSHLRRKAANESASNIEVLEKYRKERELSRKAQENIKKAS